MKDEKTEELDVAEDYEKIRQVPLNGDESEENRESQLVGASYMGSPGTAHSGNAEGRERRSRRRGSIPVSGRQDRGTGNTGRKERGRENAARQAF